MHYKEFMVKLTKAFTQLTKPESVNFIAKTIIQNMDVPYLVSFDAEFNY